MASDPVVEFDGIAKRYSETTAVADVSFTVDEGEFFTLVGPSGCGKTTTLRLLGGFEAPSDGTIRLRGEDVTDVPPEQRDIGVVFQNYALFSHMTVGENVAYGLKFTDPPDDVNTRQRVTDLLELVDLPGMADRDPTALSGGQRQRVAIARALAPGPDVLLLDEPMSALDARLRERLRVEIQRLQETLGITTIYVTHDQEEALAISDRVTVMQNGQAEQIATPRTVYHRPATRFVAEFIGDNNVFSGTVTDDTASTGDTETVTVDLGGTAVDIATQDHQDIRDGDTMVFCVRPEQFSLDRTELTTTVASSEFLGWTTRYHLDWQGRELLVRTTEPLNGTITLGFGPDDAHLVTVD